MSDKIDIDSDNLKDGLLGLVVALVEIIRDALKLQAIRRMDNGRLTDEQIEKLGSALIDLDNAVEDIKQDQEIADSVDSTRAGLNDVIEEALNPETWVSERED
ncbi:gas vesicle protein K [Candidatus Bipolaricaulota bacterium]|nr:gas vesicle protein K [Candidatus Bipolaricaulota bacterium]